MSSENKEINLKSADEVLKEIQSRYEVIQASINNIPAPSLEKVENWINDFADLETIRSDSLENFKLSSEQKTQSTNLGNLIQEQIGKLEEKLETLEAAAPAPK